MVSRRSAAETALTLGVLALSLGGCLLVGIEPDEIDVAGTDEQGVDETGENDTQNGTTGQADTGDGDGDEHDPTTDTGEGDGDGDPGSDLPCADFDPEPVVDGPNPIEVPVGSNTFSGSCGGLEGPDAIFSYTATSQGLISFALEADFDAVFYLVGETCWPLEEWLCDPELVETLMTVDQTVYIVVDSQAADVGGTATLTITGP
jgi:hypothetical protein